jgi:hypothetical protein
MVFRSTSDESSKLIRHPRSLLTPDQMAVAIHRESARADRKETAMVLALFETPARRAQAPAVRRLVRTLIRRMRVTDDIGWYDRRHIGVLLTDTTALGALQFVKHVLDKMQSRGIHVRYHLFAYPDPALAAPAVAEKSSPGRELADNQDESEPLRATA